MKILSSVLRRSQCREAANESIRYHEDTNSVFIVRVGRLRTNLLGMMKILTSVLRRSQYREAANESLRYHEDTNQRVRSQ